MSFFCFCLFTRAVCVLNSFFLLVHELGASFLCCKLLLCVLNSLAAWCWLATFISSLFCVSLVVIVLFEVCVVVVKVCAHRRIRTGGARTSAVYHQQLQSLAFERRWINFGNSVAFQLLRVHLCLQSVFTLASFFWSLPLLHSSRCLKYVPYAAQCICLLNGAQLFRPAAIHIEDSKHFFHSWGFRFRVYTFRFWNYSYRFWLDVLCIAKGSHIGCTLD